MQMNLNRDVQRSILDGIYSSLIEGMITSSFALGANLSYIYIRRIYGFIKF
jgi:NADH:ubiquinone oxidoreductase subunit F (NADH-binding)